MGLAVTSALAAQDPPTRGMHEDRVAETRGTPLEIKPAVGDPPITRWIYEGYTVYFDRGHVIHSVDTSRQAGAASAAGVGSPERGDADMATPR